MSARLVAPIRSVDVMAASGPEAHRRAHQFDANRYWFGSQGRHAIFDVAR